MADGNSPLAAARFADAARRVSLADGDASWGAGLASPLTSATPRGGVGSVTMPPPRPGTPDGAAVVASLLECRW